MTRLPVLSPLRSVLVAVAIACLAPLLARAQVAPPWGAVPYQAEVATYVDDELIGRISIEAGSEGLRYTSLDAEGAELLVFVLAWDGVDVTAWVDARTGLAIAGEGESDGVVVRTELWRFVEETPDPTRLRP